MSVGWRWAQKGRTGVLAQITGRISKNAKEEECRGVWENWI